MGLVALRFGELPALRWQDVELVAGWPRSRDRSRSARTRFAIASAHDGSASSPLGSDERHVPCLHTSRCEQPARNTGHGWLAGTHVGGRICGSSS